MKPTICVSVIARLESALEKELEEALRLGADLVELRLDGLENMKLERVRELVSSYRDKLIITLRPAWEGGGYDGDESERLRIIAELSDEKPAYMDIELETRELGRLSRLLRRRTRLIVSKHYFSGTPDVDELRKAAEKALGYGDLAKVVATAKGFQDNLRILSLYDRLPRERLIAFAMGEQGRISRILAPILGSPIAYACLPGREAAPGQLAITDFREVLGLVMPG